MYDGTRRRAQHGFNLIEVLIAMALLGVVLISVMNLFFMGRRTVYAGKQMTQAVSLGTHVLEDIQALDKSGLRVTFGIGPGAGSANTIEGESLPNSIIRTTTNITSTTDPKGVLDRWRDLIVDQNKMKNGVITLAFTPKEDPTNNPAQMLTATVVHVRVYVSWDESQRHRRVAFDAVKVER